MDSSYSTFSIIKQIETGNCHTQCYYRSTNLEIKERKNLKYKNVQNSML